MPTRRRRLDDVHLQNVLAVEKNLADQARVADRLVHAVERAQERGFAAAGGTDQRRDFVLGNVQVEAEDGLLLAIEEIQIRRSQSAHDASFADAVEVCSVMRDLRREPCGDGVVSMRGWQPCQTLRYASAAIQHEPRSPDIATRTNASSTNPAAQACRCQSS